MQGTEWAVMSSYGPGSVSLLEVACGLIGGLGLFHPSNCYRGYFVWRWSCYVKYSYRMT